MWRRTLGSLRRYFKVNVFYCALDIFTFQIRSRFEGLKRVSDRFEFIYPSKLISASEEEIHQNAEKLVSFYEKDLSSALTSQLLLLRSCLESKINSLSTVFELAKLVIIEQSVLCASFPEVITALILFLTIPVTVARTERSFSKLKLIKNYLRSTMTQQRLSGLAVIAIESEKASRTVNMEELITSFAERKARREKFL